MKRKKRDLTQTYVKNLYTHRKIQTATWQHKNATKTPITQRLLTDLGQSVWATTATQSGVVKPAYGIQNFQLTTKAVLSKNTP